MRIGLVRHFPVAEPLPTGWLTAAQLHAWRERYELAEARLREIAFDASQWARCYSSDLKRAFATAQAIHPGPIVQTPLLREAQLALFGTGELRIPVWLWSWIVRGAWLTGHRSQRAVRDAFMLQVKAAADLAESEASDVLLVSHAATMAFLRKELLRRGYRGPRFHIAEHARLYVFEK